MSFEPDIDEEVGSFFEDPDASNAMVLATRQVVAPIIQGAPITQAEVNTGGGVRVVYFIMDASPSMNPVADELVRSFNEDFVPAVREAREDDISILRIGGCIFNSGDPHPIWAGADGSFFHPLDELPPLTEYYTSGMTALHLAIIQGSATAFTYAGQVQMDMASDVEVDIVILSDGKNNMSPMDTDGVRQLVDGRVRSRVRYLFFYFDTSVYPDDRFDPRAYAINELGFDPELVYVFGHMPGETDEERQHRFRALMQVMSRVSASRGTSAVAAAAAVLGDDDIV